MTQPQPSRLLRRALGMIAVSILALLLVVLLLRPSTGTPEFLSATERDWLKQHAGQLEVLFGYEAPPNAFHDDSGQYTGLLVDYLHEIENLLDIQFTMRDFATWDALIEYAREGEPDFIVVGIADTVERRDYLLFTDTFVSVPYIIIMREDAPAVNSLSELQDAVVCTVKDYAVNQYIARQFPDITPVEYIDNLAGLRAVSTGQCDAMVVNQAYATYLIQEQGLANLVIAGDSGYQNRLSAASPVSNPILHDILEKAVDAIPQERHRELYQRWINPQRSTDFWQLMEHLIRFGAAGLALLLLSWVWAVSLQAQVRTKTRVISAQILQLETTQEELQLALENERTQHRLNEALLGIATSISSTLDTEDVMQRILIHVGDVVPHDAASIMLLQDNQLQLAYWQGLSEETVQAVNNQKPEIQPGSIFWEMLHTHKPILISDTQACDRWQMLTEPPWVKSYLGVPIRSRDTVIGFLNLDSTQPDFFDEQHAISATTLAHSIAIAVENARLYERLEDHAQELEARVASRTAQLERLSQVKDEFVSNVSHELKTPITTFSIRHYLLRKNPERLEEHLTVLERETARLNYTVENLLQLSRLDQSHVHLASEPVDLNTLAQTLVNDRALLAQEKEIALSFTGQPELPLVLGDSGLLEQVLSILLTNAINYTPAGGEITIYTHTGRYDGADWVGLCVKDTGPGIPPDEHPHLFERFFQGSASRKSGVPGTGLGLSIAQEIITRHAGRIDVLSTGVAGEGAAFTIWLKTLGESQPDQKAAESTPAA